MSAVAPRWAILYPGDRAARDRADGAASRFAALFEAFRLAGVDVEPAVYHDDFCDEVEAQLLQLRGVLVWHNPIEDGRTRQRLDTMLRRVADRGVFVSAHPDTILRMGTKDVLVDVRDLPFGCDTHRVDSVEQLAADLPQRLALGPRVLKQHRGHSGIGVWRVAQEGDGAFAVRHAQRGAQDERGPFSLVLERLAPYFAEGGHMVDQAWQSRLPEGMVRAYLVCARLAGFGHQAVNALYPAAPGQPARHPARGCTAARTIPASKASASRSRANGWTCWPGGSPSRSAGCLCCGMPTSYWVRRTIQQTSDTCFARSM